ncbi:RDD family protein [Hymenobacter radiodurans]|uniref:RDD family protein n=1 Tax=Hymenobacter radiodurans TaxID=2496028 RepID=UPI001058FEAB|nr:RDD family protein [Hymenobacter radiodurans]
MIPDKSVNVGTRLGSMLIDHFFMIFICMAFSLPLMIKQFSEAFTISHEPQKFGDFTGPLFQLSLLGFALYFCKDCINGRSIAKRILKLQVVNNKTLKVASPLRCFLRDIFIIIWPIEVVVALINPSRRIGDLIAGTKVIAYDSVSVQKELNFTQVVISVALSFGLISLLISPIYLLMPAPHKVEYIETSYNSVASKALEKLYTDSLSENLEADVKVYDKIKNSNLKYISVIYKLKENYLEDESKEEKIKKLTMSHLYSMYPENEFTGQAQYIYKTDGSMQNNTNYIGVQNASSSN